MYCSKLRAFIFAVLSIGLLLGGTVSSAAIAAPAAQEVQAAVNINTANVQELAKHLSGVGTKKAEAIVAYRKANGGFSTKDELLEVKGIGEATLNKNRSRIIL